MKTYTVGHCTDPLRGESLESAAMEILSYDGQTYEIRRQEDDPKDRYWSLWTKRLNDPRMEEAAIFSLCDDPVVARDDIFHQVIDHYEWWVGDNFVCMTDEDYNEMLAEQESEQ